MLFCVGLVQLYDQACPTASSDIPCDAVDPLKRDRATIVDERFEHAFAEICADHLTSKARWEENVAANIQRAIRQADWLMDELALGLAQTAQRKDIAEWYTQQFHAHFLRMLLSFGSRLAPSRLVTGSEQVVPSNVHDNLSTTDAMAIIGWCNRFAPRCSAMGLPVDSIFDENPTQTGVFQALLNAHTPSYRGYLKKKASESLSSNVMINKWQRRWFELSNGSLRYYKSNAAVTERGCIPGVMITEVTINSTVISLTWAGHTTELSADNAAEAHVWYERLVKTREAAVAMEQLASQDCFEVEAFDGQRRIALHTIAKDCAQHFAVAEQKVQDQLNSGEAAVRPWSPARSTQASPALDSSAVVRSLDFDGSDGGDDVLDASVRATLYMDAVNVLLRQLEVRVARIPLERVDVRSFYTLEYHRAVCEHMFAVRDLSRWSARHVCKLIFWARAYDNAIAELLGRHLLASETPLATFHPWEHELPGFASHPLPHWEGWLVKQRRSNHKWERRFVVITNLRMAWHETKQDRKPRGSIDLMRGTTITARHVEDSTVSAATQTRHRLKVSTRTGVVFLEVSDSDLPAFQRALVQSCSPNLPGQSRLDTALDSSFRSDAPTPRHDTAAVPKLLHDFQSVPHAELEREIAEEFARSFRQKSESIAGIQTGTDSSHSQDGEDVSPACFSLDTVLELLSEMLARLMNGVDEVLFSEDSSEVTEAAIAFHVRAHHAQFERYVSNLCEGGVTLPDVGPDVTVTKATVVPLLKWCAYYGGRIESIGQDSVRPLQHCCRTPMAQHIAEDRSRCHDWLSRLRTVETVEQDDSDGLWHSSVPKDLFDLVYRTTHCAAASQSEWLLMNTIMGVIVPQVRLWASDFADELATTRGGSQLGLKCAARLQCSELQYLCATLNAMEECYRLTSTWTEEVIERFESADIMEDGSEGALNTDAVTDGFRAVSDQAAGCVVALVLLDLQEPLQTIASVDWVEQCQIRVVLDTLASYLNDLERWISERLLKKVLSQVMRGLLAAYTGQLLLMGHSKVARKRRALQGDVESGSWSSFMLEDIDKFKRFFGTYLKETSVRLALKSAEMIAQLYSCPLEDFNDEVLKAAYHPDFTIHTVEQVLQARDDTLQMSTARRNDLLQVSRAAIQAIKDALHPSAPPRSSSSLPPAASEADIVTVPVPDGDDLSIHRSTSTLPQPVDDTLVAASCEQGISGSGQRRVLAKSGECLLLVVATAILRMLFAGNTWCRFRQARSRRSVFPRGTLSIV